MFPLYSLYLSLMGLLTPLLSATFPLSRPGSHKNIGYAFISTPVLAPWSLKSPSLAKGRPALNLSEIGYAVFYPSEKPKWDWYIGNAEGTVDWLSDPKPEVVKGYERVLGKKAYWLLIKAIRIFLPRMKFRANADVPLKTSTSKYPLVIFSHGLAGTRTTYAQYCSALASEGYVVLAIEHKDGSGPLVTVPNDQGDKDGLLHYVRDQDLTWSDEDDPSLAHFRTLQLEMRTREVYEAFHSFQRVVSGEALQLDESLEWLASVRDKIDTEHVHLTGHSFGGATVINTLQNPPPDVAYAKLPITRAIALDPWLEPLAAPAPSTQGSPAMPPLLVLNSPGFTIWDDHVQRVVKLVKAARGSLITIMKGNHQSFSDIPLLLPPASGTLRFLSITHQLSMYFLQGKLASAPILQGLAPDGGKISKDDKGKMSATTPVVVHLLGQE